MGYHISFLTQYIRTEIMCKLLMCRLPSTATSVGSGSDRDSDSFTSLDLLDFKLKTKCNKASPSCSHQSAVWPEWVKLVKMDRLIICRANNSLTWIFAL